MISTDYSQEVIDNIKKRREQKSLLNNDYTITHFKYFEDCMTKPSKWRDNGKDYSCYAGHEKYINENLLQNYISKSLEKHPEIKVRSYHDVFIKHYELVLESVIENN